MAEETLPKPSEPEVPATDETEENAPAAEAPPPAEPATQEAVEAAIEAAVVAEGEGVSSSASFKEETNVVAELEDPEKKAIDELKALIQSALANNEFSPPAPVASTEVPPAAPAAAAEEPSPSAVTEELAASTPAAGTEEPVSARVMTEEPAAAAPAATEEAKAETVEAKTEVQAEIEEPQKTKDPAPPVEDTPADNPVVVAEEDDGAKTVKAIEETAVPSATAEPEAPAPPPEEVFIWGLPLLGDEKSDTVLLKFLRARDFKVKDALAMIKNAVVWRKQFGIEALVEEDLEVPELEKVVFNHGFDKEGHPVCYNVYGEFKNKELYAKVFGDEEKREKFLRWRIQYLEKGIRQQLDFSPGAISTMVQVNDFKNLPGPGKKELRLATKKALALLQDNYPEFVAKQVFINVPWWYLAYNRVISPFFTQRSKSKFVFAGPSKSADTLFKYIAPEQVPVQYGGLSKETNPDFSAADAVTVVAIKPASKHTVDIPATEGDTLVWELRVLGWEVSYTAEFVPSAEEGYTVIVQKASKFSPADNPYVKNSFKIGEAGKVVLTIDNATSKKKKLLYRSKAKPSTESI